MGTTNFDLEKITVTGALKEVKDNKLLIKFEEELIKSFDIVSISSEEYDLTKDYICIGTDSLETNQVNVINGTKEVNDNKLLIKYENEILKEFNIVSYSSEKYDLTK